MKEIYMISGLGADHRLFIQQFQAGLPVRVLPWIVPEKRETLSAYALRMCAAIPAHKGPVILGGVSFGGMMAVEMSKHIPVEKVILISSVKTYRELPLRIRFWKYIPLYRILHTGLIKEAGILARHLFGIASAEEAELFAQMVSDTPTPFIPWAVHQIVNWTNTYVAPNTIHIHGTSDHIFPIDLLQEPVIRIQKGTHIMIVTKADAVNAVLRKELE